MAVMVSTAVEVSMRKTINAMRARGNLGQILEEVYYRGDQYIIERSGKAMAAVVPVEQYEQWRQEREAFFRSVEEIRRANRDRTAQETEQDLAAARRAARRRR
jgi:prevent-host-death family protein